MKGISDKEIKERAIVPIDITREVSEAAIEVPRLKYKIVAEAEMETVFHGSVTPIPTVLINFLRPLEMKLFLVIMRENTENGDCKIGKSELAIRVNVSTYSVNAALDRLERMGIISTSCKGNRKTKYMRINFDVIQHLEELMKGENPLVGACIREQCKKYKIINLTQKDVDDAYNEYVLKPGHDPEEEEIYD